MSKNIHLGFKKLTLIGILQKLSMTQVIDPYIAKYDLELELSKLRHLGQLKNQLLQIQTKNIDKFSNPLIQTVKEITLNVSFGKLIISYWGEHFSRSWQIAEYTKLADSLLLIVKKQSGKISEQLVITPLHNHYVLLSEKEAFTKFCHQFIQLIIKTFHDLQITKIHKNFTKSISTRTISVCFTYKEKMCMAIGAFSKNPKDIANILLTSALEWSFKKINHKNEIHRILIFTYVEFINILAKRLTLINCNKIELYEVDSYYNQVIQRIFPSQQLELITSPIPDYTCLTNDNFFSEKEKKEIDFLKSLIPQKLLPNLDIQASTHNKYLKLNWLGLEFAYIQRKTSKQEAALYFGIPKCGQKIKQLSNKNIKELSNLIELLSKYRTSKTIDHNHILYRTQSERWLETIIFHNIEKIDPLLNKRFIYKQVPTHSLTQNNYADLMGITTDNQIAIIELKTNENKNILWQGLDYWYCIYTHIKHGSFRRHGYFQECNINIQLPPILYLIAPALRFHSLLKPLLKQLSNKIPVNVIGISEHWRQDLQIIFREKF